MSYLKSSLITFFLLLCLLCGYIYFKFDSEFALEKATESYQGKDYTTSRQFIEALKKKKNPTADLCLAYISRAEGQMEKSDKHFRQAVAFAKTVEQKNEIEFNFLLNAYLEGNYEKITLLLNQFSLPEEMKLPFIALIHHRNQNFFLAQEALIKFKNVHFDSPWMQQDRTKYLGEHFFVTHLAHCYIENKEFQSARQILERYLLQTENKEPQLYYLLGLSYFKEGKDKKVQDALSYYQNAFQFFKRVPLWEKECFFIKGGICNLYEEIVEHVCHEKAYQLFTTYVDALDFSNFNSTKLSQILLHGIENEVNELNGHSNIQYLEQLALLIQNYCHYPHFKQTFLPLFLNHIQTISKDVNLDESLKAYTYFYNTLFSNSIQAQALLLTKMLPSIFDRVAHDDHSLTQTLHLLNTLDAVALDGSYALDFTKELFPFLHGLWISDSGRAYQMTKLLDETFFQNQEKLFHTQIQQMLSSLQPDLIDNDHFEKALKYFR